MEKLTMTDSPGALPLDPPVAIALTKGLAKLTADVTLAPGTYPVDETLTLRVAGSVKRAPDIEVSPAVDVPWTDLLACALERAGCGRQAAKTAIEAALVEVETGYVPRNPDRIRDVIIAIDGFKASRKGSQVAKIRAGATTAQVVIEVLSGAERRAA
jgi:hypothetical protein